MKNLTVITGVFVIGFLCGIILCTTNIIFEKPYFNLFKEYYVKQYVNKKPFGEATFVTEVNNYGGNLQRWYDDVDKCTDSTKMQRMKQANQFIEKCKKLQ